MPTFHLRRAVTLLLAALAQLPSVPVLAGGSDPKAMLDDIYGQVMTMCGGDGQGATYDLEAIAKTYFTPSLAKKITKGFETGELDWDLLVDGNDCKVTGLDLKIVGGGDTTAIGRAAFDNLGEKRIVELNMAKTGNDWEVVDIVYRHRPFSLKTAF
jgi:hypothetical protein